MCKKYDVICIGFIVQDIVMSNIPYDALTRDTSVADEGLITSGGDAANQAVTLSYLGSHTALLVKIGWDTVGNTIYSGLENDPLDLDLIIRDERATMMLSIVVIMPDGERAFLVKPGNEYYYLKPEDVPDEVLRQTRAITIGSLFCLPGLDGPGVAGILERAHKYDVITICDITYDLNNIGPDAQRCVYPHVDYMMPSMEEALYITGEKDPDKIADTFLSWGVKNVLLKLGSEGCFFKNSTERFFSDPYQVTTVDTTGCGDSFVAAFTHGLLKGWSHEKCADFACATGALNATGLGAHLTIKSEQQVLDFMASTPKTIMGRERQ